MKFPRIEFSRHRRIVSIILTALAIVYALVLTHRIVVELLYVYGIDPIEVEFFASDPKVLNNIMVTHDIFYVDFRKYRPPFLEKSMSHVDISRLAHNRVTYIMGGAITKINIYLSDGWRSYLVGMTIRHGSYSREYSPKDIEKLSTADLTNYNYQGKFSDVFSINETIVPRDQIALISEAINGITKDRFKIIPVVGIFFMGAIVALIFFLRNSRFFDISAPKTSGYMISENWRCRLRDMCGYLAG